MLDMLGAKRVEEKEAAEKDRATSCPRGEIYRFLTILSSPQSAKAPVPLFCGEAQF